MRSRGIMVVAGGLSPSGYQLGYLPSMSIRILTHPTMEMILIKSFSTVSSSLRSSFSFGFFTFSPPLYNYIIPHFKVVVKCFFKISLRNLKVFSEISIFFLEFYIFSASGNGCFFDALRGLRTAGESLVIEGYKKGKIKNQDILNPQKKYILSSEFAENPQIYGLSRIKQ